MRLSKAVLMRIVFSLLIMVIGLTGAQDVFAYTVGHDGDDPVHEYTVERGMALYLATQSNTEMLSYLDTIKAGAKHEDLHDHVADRSGIYLTQPHFWDGDKGPDDPVDNLIWPLDSTINSWQKAQVLWGMALGEYRSGDKSAAYEYLGHVAHLLADQSVPAHAHEDAHPEGDIYEDWMTSANAQLTTSEMTQLISDGPVDIPEDTPFGPLYYLFYTMNQIGDYFPSDGEDGDSGWNAAYGDWIGDVYANLPEVDQSDLDDGDDNTAILQTIRAHSYLYAIRATAALFDLCWEEASSNSALTVVIDRIKALDNHEEPMNDGADFFMRIWINGLEYWNEGDQMEDDDDDDISPGWGFGRNVGITGVIPVVIQVWDEDEEGTAAGDDDPSAIDPVEGRRDLDFSVDLETGAISGDINGTCGQTLTSSGHPEDDDRSTIWFRVLLPNIPPTAEAGDDQTVDEGDLVTLNGTFTDPNEEDTHTFLWHLESSTNGQSVPDSTSQSLSFTPNDNGVYTFSFTVTDNFGASGSDEVVVTALNVPPVASIDSLKDELGAEIGVDVPVALVGLEIDLEGSFTDVGTADTHTAEIHWGDGITDTAFDAFSDCVGGTTGTVNDAHIYAIPGIHTITLSVTDDDNGVGTTTAQIEIVDAAGAIAHVIESLTPLADDPNIQAAIDKLQGNLDGDAINGALDMLEMGNLNAALEKIKQALEYLEAAEAADPSLDLMYDKGLLALAGKSITVGAIAEAAAVAFKSNDLEKIQQATYLVTQGDALLAAQNYVGAMDKYQRAVREVQNP